ncbi:MAG: four helix bundle protein [Firmicutes bacterium]|nr:four helix bundle protein [Bacillota bacterium]
MKPVLESSFDFSIRAMELIKYLEEEKKPFPLYERFLTCAMGMGIYLRLAQTTGRKSAGDSRQALLYAVEAEYLLEIMAKTGYLQEKQSHPILDDCRALKAAIAELFQE